MATVSILVWDEIAFRGWDRVILSMILSVMIHFRFLYAHNHIITVNYARLSVNPSTICNVKSLFGCLHTMKFCHVAQPTVNSNFMIIPQRCLHDGSLNDVLRYKMSRERALLAGRRSSLRVAQTWCR